MLSSSLNVDEDEVLDVLNYYTKALEMLDDYDHLTLKKNKNKGDKPIYKLTYKDVDKVIKSMSSLFNSDIFGKEKGKLNGILEAVEQTAFGKDLYESV